MLAEYGSYLLSRVHADTVSTIMWGTQPALTAEMN